MISAILKVREEKAHVYPYKATTSKASLFANRETRSGCISPDPVSWLA